MIHITCILADSLVVATVNNATNNWDVILTDAMTGKTEKVTWTNLQMSAVMALAIGYGEESDANATVTDELYKIAEPLFKDLQKEVRCIP